MAAHQSMLWMPRPVRSAHAGHDSIWQDREPAGTTPPGIPRPGSIAIGTPWGMPALPQRRPDYGLDPGVYLPFTAPMLCGVRVRASQHELEFILPNPSGGRGVYVAGWSVVTGFAAPTLHDTLLVGRLSGRNRIGPADVREAARLVALDGHAGQHAAETARQALAGLATSSLRLRALFLLTLARRSGFGGPKQETSCLNPAGFGMLASRIGWQAPQLADAIEWLSVQFASIVSGSSRSTGPIPASGAAGRWGRLLSLVHRFRRALVEEQYGRNGPDVIILSRIAEAADRCIQRAELLLPEIEAMLADPQRLLDDWRDGGGGIVAPPWLNALETAFDGWDRICLLWFDAGTPYARQALIPEISVLARVTGSTDGWPPVGSHPSGTDVEMQATRELVERNERIRSLELTIELDAG
ncbi:MAG: hypothetical protein ACRYGI_01085 [Janthinobacterium lividum]